MLLKDGELAAQLPGNDFTDLGSFQTKMGCGGCLFGTRLTGLKALKSGN